MMNHNPLYGIIDQSYIQRQLMMQQIQSYHINQQWKTIECARKFDEFLKSAGEVAPEYQHAAISACCLVAEQYMSPQKIAI